MPLIHSLVPTRRQRRDEERQRIEFGAPGSSTESNIRTLMRFASLSEGQGKLENAADEKSMIRIDRETGEVILKFRLGGSLASA